MANDKPGFYIWFKTVDAMAELTMEEKGRIYTAVEDYSRYGNETAFEDRLLRSIWVRLKSDLDADDAQYKKKQRENQIKGWKSDFKRNYAPAHGIDPNDEAALETYIQQRLTTVDSGEQMSTNNNININSNSSINTNTNNNININSNSSINTNTNNNISNSVSNKGIRETRRNNGFSPDGRKTSPSAYHPPVSVSAMEDLVSEIERRRNREDVI